MTELPITPRENWIRMLRREKPMWMPTYSGCQLFMPKIIPDNIARAMVIETETVPPDQVGGKDMFGINWVYVPTVNGSMEDPDEPHLLDDVSEWREKVKFPNMDEWDWAGCAARNKDFFDPNRFRQTWFFTGFFERLISFMGFEDAAMTLIDEDSEEDLHALFDALADNAIDFIGRMKKWFDIDGVYFHDDWGSQRSPFFSLRVARDVIGPHMKKVVDYCHEIGVYFDLHSCGMIEDLVPAMLDIGIDCWCGQDVCDKFRLYDKYADKLPIGVWLMPDAADPKGLADRAIEHAAPDGGEKFMYVMNIGNPPLDGGTPFVDYVREKTLALYAG